MTQHRSSRLNVKGFTIVELMIAMAFISLLLLAIAGIVMQLGSIYNKGVTLKSVNQAGRSIVADMKQTVAEGQPFDVTIDSSGYQPQRHDGIAASTDYDGGRLCTSSYSYIWNIGKHIDPNDPSSQRNKYQGSDSTKPLRFIRIRDDGGQYCRSDKLNAPIPYTDATELLSEDELAIQDFSIKQLTGSLGSDTTLYNIGIVVSNAYQDTIYLDTDNDYKCNPPSGTGASEEFCAVNKFEFVVRAGSRGGQ